MSRVFQVGLSAARATTRAPLARRAFSTAAQAAIDRIKSADLEKFDQRRAAEEIQNLTSHTKDKFGGALPSPFASDTGSTLVPETLAAKIWRNAVLLQNGFDPKHIEEARGAIRSLFADSKNPIKSEREEAVRSMKVYFTSSTTQANKVAVSCVSNINSEFGDIAIAAHNSHVFLHEVGQPAEKVFPENKVTGKLTVADLDKAAAHYEGALGKRIKILHLDQPTNGDYFYTEEELKSLSTWAHAKGIPVSMDVERVVNFLPGRYDSYHDLTVKCGIDVVTLGMQKNGGARSSAVVVLDEKYLSDREHLDRRAVAFFKKIGNVTNNRTFITSGWKEMVEGGLYQKNAAKANAHAKRIAEVIKNFTFDEKLLEIQNYPLTTNMIFAKFPRDFVNFFNSFTKEIGDGHLQLMPDRNGVTRIVGAHDTMEVETDHFIECLTNAYEKYSAKKRGDEVKVEDVKIEIGEVKDLDPAFTAEEIGSVAAAIVAKVSDAVIVSGNGRNGVSRKFSPSGEAPIDPAVITRMIIGNTAGYHLPYGDDDVTHEAKDRLRKVFQLSPDIPMPIAFTSSKDQAISCVMQFLKATDESVVLVSQGSASEHLRFGRNVKPLDLSGDYQKMDKLDPRGVEAILSYHNTNRGKHVPLVAGVMIQQPTQSGYVYTPEEIEKISGIAHKHNVPVIMQTIGFSYHLAKTGETYKKYTTDCGVDACTVGFQGLGGSLSSAVVVLNPSLLPFRSDDHLNLQIFVDRTVKENGGKQSDSSTLVTGWSTMLEEDRWRANANKANASVEKIISALREVGVEFENKNPAHNIIALRLSEKALKNLNESGYEFKMDRESGYVKIRVPYSASGEEVDKFIIDVSNARAAGLPATAVDAKREEVQKVAKVEGVGVLRDAR
jgi:threonine aldolase